MRLNRMRQLNNNTNKRKWIQSTYDVRVKIEKLLKKANRRVKLLYAQAILQEPYKEKLKEDQWK